MFDEEDVSCLICAFPFDTNERVRCVGVCGHDNVCSICFLRLRSLQRTFSCASCKQQLDHVICTNTVGAQFSDFTIWGDTIGPGYTYDEKSQMFFPKEYHKVQVEALWAFKCGTCKQSRRDMKQLRQHLHAEHNLHMCELCIDNKQSFPSEQKVYKQIDYENHLRKGDGDGSEGHPKCEFCRKRYYDKTGLFMHLSRDHFNCHLCERAGIQFKYFSDYKHLEEHFRREHLICEDPLCLAKRYVVFSNGIDLAAHSLQIHPFMQSRRVVPIHFKVRRPQDQEGKEGDEDEEGRDGAASRHAGGNFEGGMGGRARGGEWQVELSPTTRDPRDVARTASHAAADASAFVSVGRTFEDNLEEYPALAKESSGALTIGNWGKPSNDKSKKQDFPELGGSKKQSGRSFSGVTTGPSIKEGKVGGAGVGGGGGQEAAWVANLKKDKRLRPAGISKPTAMVSGRGIGKCQGDENDSAFKDPPSLLNLRPQSGEKVGGDVDIPATIVAKTPTLAVRSQPQYASLAVLERDNSMSYKVSSTSNGVTGKEKTIEECEPDGSETFLKVTEVVPIVETEKKIKRVVTEPLEIVEKIAKVDRSENIQKEKKVSSQKNSVTVAGPSAGGWGSAFKSSGIGATNLKKPGKGLSLAKPLITKKNSSSPSLIDIAESIDRGKKDMSIAITRSFDDLKQIGRLQRDLMAQQLQEVPSTKNNSNSHLSLSLEDLSSLSSMPPPAPEQKAPNGNNNSTYGNSSRDGIELSMPAPPTLPPGLSVEQRNESIKAFVEEVRRKKALDQNSTSSSEKDSKTDTIIDDTNNTKGSSKKKSNESGIGWAKTGGVTEKIDVNANSSVSSISNIDYPSLAPKVRSTQLASNNVEIPKWGEKPSPPIPKSASDLLLAKKNKAANKIKNR